MRFYILFAAAMLFVPAEAQTSPDIASVLTAPVGIERREDVTSVPLRPHMGKVAIMASLNGAEREFVFDTGSPSMISRALADELGLELVGQNRGRDANGAEVVTDVAIVDRLDIGGISFRSVPVLIHDFTAVDPDGCFIRDGVIGSEIFPGSAWRMDAGRQVLEIAGDAALLMPEDGAEPPVAGPLEDFGYPHAPVFRYSIGGFEDRGLFDTGSSDSVTLFSQAAGNRQVKKAMVRGTLRTGRGSEGISAGGAGEETDLARFDLEGMKIGEVDLGRQSGTLRQVPPSLLGLGILDNYRVTLDYPGGRILFELREEPARGRVHPGYALQETADGVRVLQLYKGSAAAKAGLKLHDEVVAIDGQPLTGAQDPCVTARWLAEGRPAETARTLTIRRSGKAIEIKISGD
ncbi:aspartyl protease family protein [Hyphomonas jannaschiana]|uniref:PDZ domain-containing protein n=1 Tax=Hyphomonas jannaschiana VP2 TaxID=1280952 RepID=A0A059FGB0_9PROT|nr:aspartyl protease family protein [Hyphomonas jannaschiana]KCZ89674.1 hypothetical protein HJA_05462 [Hyphomonas jannaschiana VP2]